MEKNKNRVRVDTSLIDESISIFKNLWDSKMNNIVKVKNQEEESLVDCKRLYLQLEKQYLVESLAKEIATKLNLNVLEIAKIDDGRIAEAVLYSNPTERGMYTVFISSMDYGIVDQVFVSFYYSIELMYTAIAIQYHATECKRWHFTVRQTPKDILSVFY